MVREVTARIENGLVSNSTVKIRFVGCGDAFCSGGQFHTCFLIDDEFGRVALDFGATSLAALHQCGIAPASIDLIIVSHLHGDHFGGLPFLLMAREFTMDDVSPLTLVGPPGFKARLIALMNCLYPDVWREEWKFDLTIIEIEPGSSQEILGRKLQTWLVNHFTGDAPATALKLTCGDKTVGFSGDTGWCDALVDVAQGTDLFICECNDFLVQSFDGHMNLPTLLEKRALLKTKRLIMNHMGPEMLANRASLEIEFARDGLVFTL